MRCYLRERTWKAQSFPGRVADSGMRGRFAADAWRYRSCLPLYNGVPLTVGMTIITFTAPATPGLGTDSSCEVRHDGGKPDNNPNERWLTPAWSPGHKSFALSPRPRSRDAQITRS